MDSNTAARPDVVQNAMTDLPWYLIAIVGALLGALGLRLFQRPRPEHQPPRPPLVPPVQPDTTVEELEDELFGDQLDAITHAAEKHDVPTSTVEDLVAAADKERQR